MTAEAWRIATWPTISLHVSLQAKENWPIFRHTGTKLNETDPPTSLGSGHTTWVAEIGDSQIGLAWHWLEIRPAVLVHADPNGIYTNLRLQESVGDVKLGELRRIVILNSIIYELRWQDVVNREIEKQRRVPRPHSATHKHLLQEA
jgi:hypothetical protein